MRARQWPGDNGPIGRSFSVEDFGGTTILSSEYFSGAAKRNQANVVVFEEIPDARQIERLAIDATVSGILVPDVTYYSHFSFGALSKGLPAAAFALADLPRADIEVSVGGLKERGNLKPSMEINLLVEPTTVLELQRLVSTNTFGIGPIKLEYFLSGSDYSHRHLKKLIKNIKELSRGSHLLVRFPDYSRDKSVPTSSEFDFSPFGLRGLRILDYDLGFLQEFVSAFSGAFGSDIALILPMVAHESEIKRVKSLLPDVQLGVTIETPSSLFRLKEICSEVEVIELGINDLTQYLSAWNRDVPHPVFTPDDRLSDTVFSALKHLMDSISGWQGRVICGLDLPPSETLSKQLEALQIKEVSSSAGMVSIWASE